MSGEVDDIVPGKLLVATPELLDPNFSGTVVLLLDVDDDGTLGVVLNRPSVVPVADVLESWGGLVATPDRLFVGGPVGTDGALGVARLRPGHESMPGFREVTSGLGVIDLDMPTEIVGSALDGLRIFAGYAGWSAGQLEREIEEGSWLVVPGELPDVFGDHPDGLLRDVLRRQPGDLAWHSTRPVDPDLN